jgi:DNA-directed RNA polymerase specialized sigma24 family protein
MSRSDTSDLQKLRRGEPEAARALWERYFDRLAGLARHILRDAPRRAADEEDVALSAFDSFCRGVERGLYPRLDGHDSLWRLLVVITRRKAFDLLVAQGRRPVLGESALAGPGDEPPGLDQVADGEPTPAFVALMADQCRHLLQSLDDPELRDIALRRLDGYTNAEIAAQRRCSLSRIERKLRLIRKTWERLP